MPTYKIDSILQGLSSYFEEEPKAEEELADFLDRVDVAYGNADASLSEDEWQTGLASDEAYNLINHGSGSEEYWQNIFSNISRRFAETQETVRSDIPSLPSTTAPDQKSNVGRTDRFTPADIEEDENEKNLAVTDSLISEILNDDKGIDRNYLVALCEEQTDLLLSMGRTDEAALLLENLSVLYQEHKDSDNMNFALGRASLYHGNFSRSLASLRLVSASSPLAPVVSKLIPQVEALEERQAHLKKVMPAVAALEQMRMRALERLGFEDSQIVDHWYTTESYTADQHEQNARFTGRVNKGIDEMIKALIDGRVRSIEEAFTQFHTYTSLRTLQKGGPPWTGAAFRQLLLENEGDVDVERLIAWSHIPDEEGRERALLQYTVDLRNSPKASGRGFPANTIVINLDILRHSKNKQIRDEAETLYRNATGENALTGLSDAAFAGLLREGGKATVPMVLAMMIAGPAGAYVEGATVVRLAAGGMSLGRAGWTARAAGFGVEATLFWGTNDALHATLIGGGDYFTGHGLASSFLMLGGLRVLGAAWGATGGAYLAKAAQTNKALAPILGGVNKTGQLATEFSGFWGLGQFEELIGLVPQQETTLRQELTQTAMTLMQLKIAVAAGQMVTGHLAEIKTLEIKLESTETLLRSAAQRGSLTPAELARALTHIEGLRAGLDQLKSGGERPETSRRTLPPKPSAAREVREDTIEGRAASKPEYKSTREACQRVVETISRGERASRESLRAELLARVEASGQKISSDTSKAIDSMIDITLSAKRAGIIDVEGGLTGEQLTDVLTLLYVSGSPDVRIDGAELTHVPMVVEGVLGFYEQMNRGRATVADRKMVFLQALLHDAGKFDPAIRTTEGYTLLSSSPLNKTGRDIVVNPGKNLEEALVSQGISPSKVPLTNVSFLAGVLVHHDSQSVRLQIDELVNQGIVTKAEGEKMWSAIRVHGFVSSWIVNNSLGELGIKSHVFDDPRYTDCVTNYKALCQKLREGGGRVTALDLARQYPEEVRILREQFASVFTPEERAMMLGDHQGQIDIFKYLMILSTTPQSKGMNVYEILFLDGGTADPMKSTVEGIMRSHMEEQALLDPTLALSARPAFELALGWLREGLPATILRNGRLSAAHERWAETQAEGADISVQAWLKTIPVYVEGKKNSLFVEICNAVDKDFYTFYAPQTETDRPSLFALSGEATDDEITLPREIGEQPFESKDPDPYARPETVEYIDQGKSGDAPSYKITKGNLAKKGLEKCLEELMKKGNAFYLQRQADGSLKAETAGNGPPPTEFLAKIIKTPEGQIRVMAWDAEKGEWFSVLTSEMVSEDPAVRKKWREMEDEKWDKEGAGEVFEPTPEQQALQAEHDRRFGLMVASLVPLGNDVSVRLGPFALRSKHALERKKEEGNVDIVERRATELEMEINFAMFSETDEVHYGGGESTKQDFMAAVQGYVRDLFPDSRLSQLIFGNDFPPNVQAHIRRAFFTYVNEKISAELKGIDETSPARRGDDIWLARARRLGDASVSPYAYSERIGELVAFALEHKGQAELDGADRTTLERFLFVPEEEAAKRVVIDAETTEAPRGLLAGEIRPIQIDSSTFSQAGFAVEVKSRASFLEREANVVEMEVTVDNLEKINSEAFQTAFREGFEGTDIGWVRVLVTSKAHDPDKPCYVVLIEINGGDRPRQYDFPRSTVSEGAEILRTKAPQNKARILALAEQWPPEIRERFLMSVGAIYQECQMRIPFITLGRPNPNFKLGRNPDFESQIDDIATEINSFYLPIAREERFRRLNGTPKEVFEFHQAHPRPPDYRKAEGVEALFKDDAGNDQKYFVPHYVLEKIDAWVLSFSHDLQTETKGYLVTETLSDGTVMIVDFIPKSGMSVSLARLANRDEFYAGESMNSEDSPGGHLGYILDAEYKPEYNIPLDGLNLIRFHSHFLASPYQETPSTGDFNGGKKVEAVRTPKGGLILYQRGSAPARKELGDSVMAVRKPLIDQERGIGPSEKTADGWPEPPDDGSGKGGGSVTPPPTGAPAKEPITMSEVLVRTGNAFAPIDYSSRKEITTAFELASEMLKTDTTAIAGRPLIVDFIIYRGILQRADLIQLKTWCREIIKDYPNLAGFKIVIIDPTGSPPSTVFTNFTNPDYQPGAKPRKTEEPARGLTEPSSPPPPPPPPPPHQSDAILRIPRPKPLPLVKPRVTIDVQAVRIEDLGISQGDIDLLFEAHERLPADQRTEHGFFRFEDGTGVMLEGERKRTESLVLEAGDAEGGGLVKELSPVAHVHHDAPLPSIQDLLVFTARARLNQGTAQTHTVFGTIHGERAFAQMTIRVQGVTTQMDFRTSANFPEDLKEILRGRAEGIAQKARLATPQQLEAFALGNLAQDDAELCYEFAEPRARQALERREMSDADRASLQKMIGRTRLDVIEKAVDLESFLSALELYVIKDFPQNSDRGLSVLKIQLDHFEHFIEDCRFLLDEMRLNDAEVLDIMGGAYGLPRDFVEALRPHPEKFPLLAYQARSVKIDAAALKERQGAIARSLHRPHEVKRWIQTSMDAPNFADGVYRSVGINTDIIKKKPGDRTLSQDDRAHIHSKTLLYHDLEKRTVNRRHYEAIIDSLSPVELDILMELKRFFGDQLFWQVMSNPSLYPVEDARFTLLKTILNTIDFYRGSDGKIEEKYRPALEEHFVSGRQIVFGQPDARLNKETGILAIKDLWGQASEFNLMTALKFSSGDPDSFVLGEKLPYSKKDKDECDGYDRKRRVIHECKNAYLGITLGDIINDQFKKHVYSLKNNGVKTLEYDIITYIPQEFSIDRKVIDGVRDAVRQKGLKNDQTVVINLYNKKLELGRKIVLGGDGTILLDTARP